MVLPILSFISILVSEHVMNAKPEVNPCFDEPLTNSALQSLSWNIFTNW
jgi:hypothetical protein